MALEQKSADRPRARVFISYSRRDMEFADRLETGLKERGLTPLIDRTEIFAFEDWWKRVETLIVKADTIVFVLSPGAISSDICRKEVAFAASLNKRFAPIVCRSVDPAAVPEPLRRLNFIFFTDEAKFDESAGQLVEALETDIEWIRKHTEFGEAARRWAQAGRPGPRGLLLRSPTLEEAERWIAVRPQNAPLPTETTQALIAASRRAATRRRNVLSASLAAGLLMALALMGLAYWQRNVALDQRNRALITQSRFLADQANQLAQQGDQISASLLATEVLPDVASGVDRPLSAEAKAALYQSLNTIHERAILSIPSTSIERSGLSNDNRRLMTTQQDGTLAEWDLAEAKLRGVQEPFDVRAIARL